MTSASWVDEPVRDGTVSRVLRLLAIFGEAEGPVGVNLIAERAGLPVSTAHRLVNLIASHGFVQYDPSSRLYSPGAQMHRLTASLWSSGPASVAQPILNRISTLFDETVVLSLYLPDALSTRLIAKCEGTRALRYVVDMNAPGDLAWGASGKSILAHLSAGTVRRVYDAAQASDTGKPLPEWEHFDAELRVIRDRGFAASSGERIPGAQSVGAVVRGGLDAVVGGICMTFPQDRLSTVSVEQFGCAVAESAHELSLLLGAARA